MAGSTTNLGLTKPLYSEDADIDVINDNMDILDTAMAAVDSGLAIVSNNNTHDAITAGQYVYVRNHGSLAEGLYTANSAISANATLSSSNLTAVSSGALNKLNTRISQPATKVTDCNTATDPSINYYCESNTTNAPTTGWHFIKALNKSGDFCTQIATTMNGLSGIMYYRTKNSSTWGAWQAVTITDKNVEYIDTVVSNMNSVPVTAKPYVGRWTGAGSTNAPIANNSGVYIGFATSSNYQTQAAIDNQGILYIRGQINGTWQNWECPQKQIGELRFVEYSSTGSSQTRVKVTFASSSTVARRLLLFGGGASNTTILAVIYWSSSLCFLSSHGTKNISVDSSDTTSFTLTVGTYSSGSFITDADCTVTKLT